MLIDLLVVLILTAANGVLAMSELAIVSARPARLKAIEARGSRRATQALHLAQDPGRFLSTVQIGITLVGILAGTFSGARIGTRLSDWLGSLGVTGQWPDILGVGGAVVVITYISLIIGELVPKRIALRNPEAIAVTVAPFMALLSRLAAPLVWALDKSGRAVLILLGQRGAGGTLVSDEEIKSVLAEAHAADVIEPEEMQMMAGVMRLADRSARGIMTPRHEVETVAYDAPLRTILSRFRETGFMRLPAERDDDVVGVFFAGDFLMAAAGNSRPDPAKLLREVPVVSDRADALDVLKVLKSGKDHLALVFDEFGHFEGIITADDFLDAITGGLDAEGEESPAILQREDGSWLVEAGMQADELRDALGVPLPEGDFDTVAGLILSILGELPQLGDVARLEGWRFEVIDMDGRRIDKVLVSRAED
jgi:putative hemolysin